MSAAAELARAVSQRAQAATEARWLAVGVVSAIAGEDISVDLDGQTLTGLKQIGGVTVGQSVLMGIVRGVSSVQYVLIGKLNWATDITTAIGAAQGAADAAATAASAASAAAASAAAIASAAQTTANGKNRIYRQTSAPSGGTYADGDLWFDTDDGNKPYIYSGGSWLTAQDATIAAANSTAIAAQTSANGKNKIFVQSGTPTATAAGDTWIDTGNANRIKTWDGSAWVVKQFGAAAIADASMTDAQIATATITSAKILGLDTSKLSGTISSTQITDGAIIAGKIAAGAVVAGKIGADAITATEIAANAVTATEILAGAVVAGKIATDAVTANTIAANAVVAGKIATNAVTAGTIDAGAVTAGKIAAGAVTADKIDVNAMTAKNYFSAASGSRIVIGPDAYFSAKPRISFDRTGGGADVYDPYFGLDDVTDHLWVSGGASAANFGNTSIDMGLPGTTNSIILSATSNAGTTGSVTVAAGSTTISNQPLLPYTLANTTGTAANVNVGTGGLLLKSTASSARYKDDIADLAEPELDPELLYGLPVRQFRYREDYLSPGDQFAGRLVPGFIAEEVAQVYPVAAEIDGEGQAENWNPRHLIPGLLALIQSQNQRIAALEAAQL